ncbi:KDO2-lipid IV(A) lauroyltransferase [bacterium A37T11]|nr:KDO2-lipid IV(A) lauroyltransferase [bacterium A37T11]
MNRIITACIYLLSLLPFWLLYLLADLIYLVLYYIVRYRKGVVRQNLANAFPEKTAEERHKIERKFYRFLADLVVECLKMPTMSLDEVAKHIKLTNPEEILQYIKSGRSVIGVTGHYANWEFAIYGVSLMAIDPFLVIYKPLSNKPFEEIYNKIRGRFGAILVPMKQTLRKIVEYRKFPHISIFVTDQTPGKHDNSHYIQFLNQETLVFLGSEKIARITDSPVVYCHIDRVKRGHYSCTFTTLSSNPTETAEFEITHLHSKFLENIIRQKPELWLWSHRRWKHSPSK